MNLVAKESVKVNENGTFMESKLDASSSGCTVIKKMENADTSNKIRRHMEIAKSNEFSHVLSTMMKIMMKAKPFIDVSHFLKILPDASNGSNVIMNNAKGKMLEKPSPRIE